jgi:oxygen-independent coproporphyrinogen-3 oxidase
VLLSEALMLGLRLADGVDVERAERATGAAMWTPSRRSAVQRLEARGQLQRDGSRLSIPKAAWLFSDGIISQLI